MAVPYRAAHTPSERSEFAQPDVALLLTHLAYRYDGLTLPEFTAAVDRLLHGLGKEAAADHYREWVGLSAESIPQGKRVGSSGIGMGAEVVRNLHCVLEAAHTAYRITCFTAQAMFAPITTSCT